MTTALFLAMPLMLILVVFQSAVLPNFSLLGVVPQLMFVATIAWALLRGMKEGLIWAFIAGILSDLFSAGPMGVSSLAMMAAVATAVLIQRSFPESRLIMPILLAAESTFVFWFVYLLLLRVLIPIILDGRDFFGTLELSSGLTSRGILSAISSAYGLNQSTLSIILPMMLIHSILIVPFYWTFHAFEKTLTPRRVEI